MVSEKYERNSQVNKSDKNDKSVKKTKDQTKRRNYTKMLNNHNPTYTPQIHKLHISTKTTNCNVSNQTTRPINTKRATNKKLGTYVDATLV